MNYQPQRAASLSPSLTLADSKAKAMKAAGGRRRFRGPANRTLTRRNTSRTPPPGRSPPVHESRRPPAFQVRQAIADKHQRENG